MDQQETTAPAAEEVKPEAAKPSCARKNINWFGFFKVFGLLTTFFGLFGRLLPWGTRYSIKQRIENMFKPIKPILKTLSKIFKNI